MAAACAGAKRGLCHRPFSSWQLPGETRQDCGGGSRIQRFADCGAVSGGTRRGYVWLRVTLLQRSPLYEKAIALDSSRCQGLETGSTNLWRARSAAGRSTGARIGSGAGAA